MGAKILRQNFKIDLNSVSKPHMKQKISDLDCLEFVIYSFYSGAPFQDQ